MSGKLLQIDVDRVCLVRFWFSSDDHTTSLKWMNVTTNLPFVEVVGMFSEYLKPSHNCQQLSKPSSTRLNLILWPDNFVVLSKIDWPTHS